MIRFVGIVLIMTGCGGWGFYMASTCSRETASLRELIRALNHMNAELKFRQPVLSGLFSQIADRQRGALSLFFSKLSQELENHAAPNPGIMIDGILQTVSLPESVCGILSEFGVSLGNFDLESQTKGIERAIDEAGTLLNQLNSEKEIRMRNYRTLGLCAGIALVILLI